MIPAGEPASELPGELSSELPSELDAVAKVVIAVVGAVVSVALGALTGAYEAFLAPLRLPHGPYLPVALVLAVLVNPVLAWFAGMVTGRRMAGILPAVGWFVVWYLASARTREGDLLITGNNWVGLATLLAGPVAFALGIFVPALRAQRRGLRSLHPPG